MLPKKIYLNYVNEDDEYKTWSEDPVYVYCDMQNREYTDLSQVWHDAKEEPKADSLILYESIYNDMILMRYAQRESAMKSIIKWAYIEDLLPRGGE